MRSLTARKTRVLVVVENYSFPADRRLRAETLALARAGYEVTVVCPTGNGRDESAVDTFEGVRIHRFPQREAKSAPWGYLVEYAWALTQIRAIARRLAAQTGPFDVVHVCNPPDVLFLAVRSLRRSGTRAIFDHHDLTPELFRLRFPAGLVARLLYRLTRRFERMTFAAADVAIAPNESYRRVALTRGGKSEEDSFVVRIAPDTALFDAGPPDPSLKRGKRFLIAYLGTMGYQDGLDNALRALGHLRELRDDWFAVLAGDGDAAGEMRSLAHELGLDDVVDFPGFIGDEEIVRLLSTADVCLSPEGSNPLNDASTMIKVIEYMSFARPVVAFDLPETRYSALGAALFAPPTDPRAFASCVACLLGDEQLRRTLGETGRHRVEHELSWVRSEEQLLAAYARALGR